MCFWSRYEQSWRAARLYKAVSDGWAIATSGPAFGDRNVTKPNHLPFIHLSRDCVAPISFYIPLTTPILSFDPHPTYIPSYMTI
jgi:hypothetical protein